jgi:hypothetical protein
MLNIYLPENMATATMSKIKQNLNDDKVGNGKLSIAR